MYRLFAQLSGLNRLVDLYPARTEPTADNLLRQTVQIGPVVYRRRVTVHVAAAGLYLNVRPPLRSYPSVFGSSSQITAVHRAVLHMRKALRLSVGRPAVSTVTCIGRLLQSIRPYLPTGLPPAE